MLQSKIDVKKTQMIAMEYQQYDEDDGCVRSFYIVAPSPNHEAICSCDDLEAALAIVDAWNAYHIKG